MRINCIHSTVIAAARLGSSDGVVLNVISSSLSQPNYTTSRYFLSSSVRNVVSNDKTERRWASSQSQWKTTKAQQRRKTMVIGSLVVVFFATHIILLWRRRREHRALNMSLPPVEWSTFRDDFLYKGTVKSIVYQPSFHVGNVFLHDSTSSNKEKRIEHFLATFETGPGKFAAVPDVRFRFNGTADELEDAVGQYLVCSEKPNEIHLEIDSFPSYREFAFICVCTLFTLIAVTAIKL
ncbi:hypothetical protein AB6A40_003589 [Gnathostoma spinigerum]|uniref:Uncharacterized protein n=1 Tax=Gnathostoma spinigerum TaxID=75299 RepID=A0ABD6EA02_9BILA